MGYRHIDSASDYGNEQEVLIAQVLVVTKELNSKYVGRYGTFPVPIE